MGFANTVAGGFVFQSLSRLGSGSHLPDKGIDFIIRLDDDKHIDIQVKTVRENTNYVFVTKDTWRNKLRANLFLAIVLLENHKISYFYNFLNYVKFINSVKTKLTVIQNLENYMFIYVILIWIP